MEKVALHPAEWNTEAEALLAGATGDNATYTVADLRASVQGGQSTLYLVSVGREKLGYVVLFTEDFGGTKELVIQVGEAFAHHEKSARLAIPAILEIGRGLGCATARSHLVSGRFARSFKRAGFQKIETVYQMRIA